MPDEAPLPRRADYVHAERIQTRWNDNDVYGHVNNVVFYAWFDTVINRWLIAEGGLVPDASDVIGLCASSQCRYVAPATYPEELTGALRVARVGRSSVGYEIGIFRDEELLAFGSFVHVFVDRKDRRPTPIPDRLRAALERLVK
jgi:acyl-CoA thioester hydrolase